MLSRLRSRDEWKFFAVLPQADRGLAVLWWAEMQKTLAGVKARGGRVEPLDAHLGKDGLDVTQFLTPKRR